MDINFLHEQVWGRFVRMPYGHVLDYADREGNTFIPTAEECRKAMPNPLGWWTPVENGAFFTGIYLRSLIAKYNKDKNEQTAKEIEILIKGLYLLQDVGSVEGFIARGVADDGRAHYPFSSDDQFTPWVLGLYSYYNCELCQDKEAVKSRLFPLRRSLRELNLPSFFVDPSFPTRILLSLTPNVPSFPRVL